MEASIIRLNNIIYNIDNKASKKTVDFYAKNSIINNEHEHSRHLLWKKNRYCKHSKY